MGKRDGHNLDLKFIETVKTASLESLFTLLRNHRHKKAPEWKKIAIKRAILRAGGNLPSDSK